MKSFMDTESRLVIPHLIEEVPDFKKFVEVYLCTGWDALIRHTNAQQFKFYKHVNGWPMMQYKCWNTRGSGFLLWHENRVNTLSMVTRRSFHRDSKK